MIAVNGRNVGWAIAALMAVALAGCVEPPPIVNDAEQPQRPSCDLHGTSPADAKSWEPVGDAAAHFPEGPAWPSKGVRSFDRPDVEFNLTPVGDPQQPWRVLMNGRFLEDIDPDDVLIAYAPVNETVCPPAGVGAGVEYYPDVENGTFQAVIPVEPVREFPALLRIEHEVANPEKYYFSGIHVAVLIERIPDMNYTDINAAWPGMPRPSDSGNNSQPCPIEDAGFYLEPHILTTRTLTACNEPPPVGFTTLIPERVWWVQPRWWNPGAEG